MPLPEWLGHWGTQTNDAGSVEDILSFFSKMPADVQCVDAVTTKDGLQSDLWLKSMQHDYFVIYPRHLKFSLLSCDILYM